ncbi:FG-GAP repeat domain-containing protein [Colwellia echini]|uniref:VCBS repeat-containing protein n=1 Tax=Colwellia echini TaxID=1982103 RepID=A0ABY3MV81_9GAMM|nr:VCBS repeat-containing protein [Colwellia echini]TYK65019.1 VCBS repeat-containing protein [Colwellia echini]
MKKALLFNNKHIFSLFLSLSCVTLLTAFSSKADDIDFNEIIVKSPYQLTQEVIAADVLPDNGKELVTFSVDEKGNRWLIIYHLDSDKNEYVIVEQAIIPKQFYRFDLSEPLTHTLSNPLMKNQTNKSGTEPDKELGKVIKPKVQNIYFLSADTLAIYQNTKFKKLTSLASLYVQEQVNFISRGDFIQNLNNDAFDDVVIADFAKAHIFIGQGLGSFDKQSLPIKPNIRVFSNGATYTETKLYFADVNFDKKIDIFIIEDGEIAVYPQRENSQFHSKNTRVDINNSISGIDWWTKRDESGEQLDQSNLEYRKLEELRDVNADGIIDMVVRYTKASGVLDRVNDYEIYLGKNNNGILSYALQADSVIHEDGTLTEFELVDIDNDGKLEVLLAGFDIGLTQIIGALVSGAIDQDVYIFKMDDADKFPAKAIIHKDVELTFSLSSGKSGNGVVELADLNGDGLKDLVLSDDDEELKVYFAKLPTKDKKYFERHTVSYDTQLPKNGKQVVVNDLNSDGKDDILINFSRLDGEDKTKEFKVLFSK